MSEGKRRRQVVYVCMGAVAGITILVFFSLNQPSGPAKQVVGIVRSYGFIQQNDRPPTKVISLQLQSGVVVQARSTTDLVVKSGDAVRVNVYRRMFTGSETFILVGLESK